MSEPSDDRLGTSREFEIRDDDRPGDTGYDRKRPLGGLLLVLAGLGLILGAGVYLTQCGTRHPSGASVPAAGIVRP